MLSNDKTRNQDLIEMPKIMMLIRSRAGSEIDVLKELKTVEGVEDASFGFDGEIVAIVKADSMDKLNQIARWQIGRITNVTGTTIKLEDKSNVSNQIPSNSLITSTESLRDISDDTFEKLIESVMLKVYFDWKQLKVEEITKATGANKEIVQSAVLFLRSLIWNNLSGDLSIDSFQRILLDDFKFPQTKIDIVTRYFEKNKNELRFTLMFNLVKNLTDKLEATSKSFGYMKGIASQLEELKGLYGHVLDVSTSTREDVNKLSNAMLLEKKKKTW
jgi:hypothetical protein